MPETLRHPTAIIEGRAPLPGQFVTRQTYLPAELKMLGIQTLYINVEDSAGYDQQGRICWYTTYGSEQAIQKTVEPGSYAWRLRDPTWLEGDPSAYQDGHGYNSQRARTELATRRGFANVLHEMGLAGHGVEVL